MAIRRSLTDGSGLLDIPQQPDVTLPPWLTGGSMTVPPTAMPTSPQDIAPDIFKPSPNRFMADMGNMGESSAPSGNEPASDPFSNLPHQPPPVIEPLPVPPPGPTPPTVPPPVVPGDLSGDVIAHQTNQPGWVGVPGFEGDVQTGKPQTQIQGFDWGKIGSHQTSAKYSPAFYTFDQAINGISPMDPSSTPRVLAYVKANGFPNAKAISDDVIDFGDGQGPIDVKVDSGKGGWWFQNGADRIAMQGAGGGGGGTTGGTGTGGGGGTSGAGGGQDIMSLLGPFLASMGMSGGPSSASLFPAFPSGFGGPGENIQPGLNQVGQDPLDELITSGLAGLLQHGGTPFGQNVMATISDLIGRGGVTPATEIGLNRARDAEATAFKGMMSDARGELANRGTISLPGVDQGPETTAVRRISEGLAPSYADAVAGVQSHAIDVSNASLMDSLSMATGMAKDQTSAVLGAVGAGTARQQVLSNIALDVLKENHSWNQFLAEFGLKHDQVMEEMQQGRMTALVPLLQMFLQFASQSAQGFIGKS